MDARAAQQNMESIYLTEEHVALRDQVARFIAKEVEPHGEAWEEQGFVPREVLRKMGALGFFGITYPAEYGGAEADALTSLVFAEALSRTTFGGFVVTVLVHSDMASPHLVNAGSKAQLDKYLPAIIRGERITAVAVTEPDAGSDVAGIRTRARREGDGLGIERQPRCSSPTACMRICISLRRAPTPQPRAHAASRCSSSRKARPAFVSAAH